MCFFNRVVLINQGIRACPFGSAFSVFASLLSATHCGLRAAHYACLTQHSTKENMTGKRVKFDTSDGIMTGTIIKVIPGPIHNYYNIQGDNGITYPLEEWQVSFID